MTLALLAAQLLPHPPAPTLLLALRSGVPCAQVLASAGAGERGLSFAEYRAALEGVELDLHVDVPAED